MTDRHCGYVVVLDTDLREDDAQATLNAGPYRPQPVRPAMTDPINIIACRLGVPLELLELEPTPSLIQDTVRELTLAVPLDRLLTEAELRLVPDHDRYRVVLELAPGGQP